MNKKWKGKVLVCVSACGPRTQFKQQQHILYGSGGYAPELRWAERAFEPSVLNIIILVCVCPDHLF